MVVLTGVVPLLVDATVEPEPDVVVVVDPELEAVLLDEDVVPEVVAAVCVPAAAVVLPVGVVTPDKRLITPAFGETKVAAELELADVAAEALDPSSPPQAARVSVARVQSTTLRTCAGTAKAKCVIVTTPVRLKKAPPGQRYVSRTCDSKVADRDPITTNIVACR